MNEQTANAKIPKESEEKDNTKEFSVKKENLIIAFLYMVPIYNGYIYSNNDLKKHNLTKTQFRALFVVNAMPDITMSDLAEQIAISREQATRAVTPLVRRKLMIRDVDSLNRRQLKIRLSDEGRKFVYELVEEFIDTAEEKFEALSPDEINDFYNAIMTVTRTLGKIHHLDHPRPVNFERPGGM
ncbi:MAG: MarR family winged helix-turn-helix transcriptional regulator [Anaerovoracaceae bacterium]|jgi:DNA-binding MarR family transcriptional regulator